MRSPLGSKSPSSDKGHNNCVQRCCLLKSEDWINQYETNKKSILHFSVWSMPWNVVHVSCMCMAGVRVRLSADPALIRWQHTKVPVWWRVFSTLEPLVRVWNGSLTVATAGKSQEKSQPCREPRDKSRVQKLEPSRRVGGNTMQFNAALILFSPPVFLCRATVKGHRYPALQSTWILSADAAWWHHGQHKGRKQLFL